MEERVYVFFIYLFFFNSCFQYFSIVIVPYRIRFNCCHLYPKRTGLPTRIFSTLLSLTVFSSAPQALVSFLITSVQFAVGQSLFPGFPPFRFSSLSDFVVKSNHHKYSTPSFMLAVPRNDFVWNRYTIYPDRYLEDLSRRIHKRLHSNYVSVQYPRDLYVQYTKSDPRTPSETLYTCFVNATPSHRVQVTM